MSKRLAVLVTAAIAIAAGAWLSAQTPFQFAVSAVDASGAPVADLKPDDVVMTENGVKQKVTKVEPLSVPVKLTISVDNGPLTGFALTDFRNGLKGLVDALPSDMEVTLIVTAPQPRTVVKWTTDHAQLNKGIDSFGPETGGPKFTDALMEYNDRLQKEAKDKKATVYVPVLVMVSTVSADHTQYQPKEIEKAVQSIALRRARVNLIMVSTQPGDVKTVAALSTVMQSMVAKPLVQATNGRYEELPLSTGLTTMLPGWGKDLATLHSRQTKQFKVTVERTNSGNLQNPKIELARGGLNGAVTLDGFLP